MKQALIILLLLLPAFVIGQNRKELFIADGGSANFSSKAPLEIIQAQSLSLKGVIEPATKSFAFTISISSFQGFNSDIQRVHFLENYMEQKKFPQATFTGKLIEDVTFDQPGTYSVRAKGILDIHGVQKERIIRGTLEVKEKGLHISTKFIIPVAEHGIEIPKLVQQKIAEEINVTVDLEFVPDNKS